MILTDSSRLTLRVWGREFRQWWRRKIRMRWLVSKRIRDGSLARGAALPSLEPGSVISVTNAPNVPLTAAAFGIGSLEQVGAYLDGSYESRIRQEQIRARNMEMERWRRLREEQQHRQAVERLAPPVMLDPEDVEAMQALRTGDTARAHQILREAAERLAHVRYTGLDS